MTDTPVPGSQTVLEWLDPQVVARVAQMVRPSLDDIARARAEGLQRASLLNGTAAGTKPRWHSLRRVGGVPCALYRPLVPSSRSVLVYAHGGGFATGSVLTSDALANRLAAGGRCWLVSVDYSLAPESPFPVALDEFLSVIEAVREGALGWRPSSIGVGGVSAGAGIAAAAAIEHRNRDDPRSSLAIQLLDQPVLDARLETESAKGSENALVINRAYLERMWSLYVPGWPSVPISELASPASASDLHGVAPAHITVADQDPLRDEALAYADRLRSAGVAAEHKVYPGTVHGFTQMLGVPVAERAIRAQARALRLRLSDRASSHGAGA